MSEFIDTVVRVRYAETDKMGIVYYANYFIYFEIGRVEYLRQRGLDYRRMELEDDSFTVVAEAKCRYRRPAKYDDPLRIRTHVTSARRRTITFGYEILHDETGELLATGETLLRLRIFGADLEFDSGVSCTGFLSRGGHARDSNRNSPSRTAAGMANGSSSSE
jgi:acyl-CoA thioester hydrolase